MYMYMYVVILNFVNEAIRGHGILSRFRIGLST